MDSEWLLDQGDELVAKLRNDLKVPLAAADKINKLVQTQLQTPVTVSVSANESNANDNNAVIAPLPQVVAPSSGETIPYSDLFYCEDHEHTLLGSLSEYIDRKMSPFIGNLQIALEEGRKVLVLGLLGESFESHARMSGWKLIGQVWNNRTLDRQQQDILLPDGKRMKKFFNSERPQGMG